jgi:hypothetical protein
MLLSKPFLAWAVASLAFFLPQVSAQCNPLTGESVFWVLDLVKVATDLLLQQHALQTLGLQRAITMSILPNILRYQKIGFSPTMQQRNMASMGPSSLSVRDMMLHTCGPTSTSSSVGSKSSCKQHPAPVSLAVPS